MLFGCTKYSNMEHLFQDVFDVFLFVFTFMIEFIMMFVWIKGKPLQNGQSSGIHPDIILMYYYYLFSHSWLSNYLQDDCLNKKYTYKFWAIHWNIFYYYWQVFLLFSYSLHSASIKYGQFCGIYSVITFNKSLIVFVFIIQRISSWLLLEQKVYHKRYGQSCGIYSIIFVPNIVFYRLFFFCHFCLSFCHKSIGSDWHVLVWKIWENKKKW